mgnify:FL=1|jgi:hypothetical protein|tara:strand:- start:10900 stop:11028 length:129 start_codon:yes stop_codon:yes gene_type:complete
MTYKEDLIRVLRAENEILRNRIEILEIKLEEQEMTNREIKIY